MTNHLNDSKPKRLRRAKAGDLAQLTAVLWGVLLEAEQIALEDNDPDRRLKAVSSLATLAGVYIICRESGDLEQRLNALEQGAQQTKQGGAAHVN